MFKLVRYVAVGMIVLPAATLQAQSGRSTGGTAYSSAPGAAWLQSNNPTHTPAVRVEDTVLAICASPIAAPKPKAKHHTTHRVRNVVKKVVPTGIVHHRKSVAKKASVPKVKGPEHPRFMCPVVRTGPTIIGTPVAADLGSEYEVPMPGTLQADEDSPMGLLASTQDVDFSAPQIGGENHRSFLPFMWVVGGGAAGAGIFTMFVHGGHNPPPNPPTDYTPPDDPNIPPVTTAPEPGSLVLLGTGIAGLLGVTRRRRSK